MKLIPVTLGWLPIVGLVLQTAVSSGRSRFSFIKPAYSPREFTVGVQLRSCIILWSSGSVTTYEQVIRQKTSLILRFSQCYICICIRKGNKFKYKDRYAVGIILLHGFSSFVLSDGRVTVILIDHLYPVMQHLYAVGSGLFQDVNYGRFQTCLWDNAFYDLIKFTWLI